MNCLEFRRQLLSTPLAKSPVIAEHRLVCPACASYAARALALEHALKNSLQVDIPEGLASRVLLRQRLATRRRFWQRGLWAVAATVLLSVGIAMNWPGSSTSLSLEESVLAHVEHEQRHLHAHDNVSLEKVNHQLQKYGAHLVAAVATINFASPCAMRRAAGFHLVFQGEHGPVTVLIMPGDPIDRRQIIADQHYRGVVVPIQNGSLAIVAQNSQDLAMIEQRLHKAFQVTT
ncbi:MAG: DUF3379 family protein [Gammaproteobacteria bacterium]|nr:DUF3379 family protein [Gammaproteobacteria bacterium]